MFSVNLLKLIVKSVINISMYESSNDVYFVHDGIKPNTLSINIKVLFHYSTYTKPMHFI